MSSFKAMRELTLLCYSENLLSDDEFLVPWEDNQSKNQHFPWDRYSLFDLQNMDEAECKVESSKKRRTSRARLDTFWSANKEGLYAMA